MAHSAPGARSPAIVTPPVHGDTVVARLGSCGWLLTPSPLPFLLVPLGFCPDFFCKEEDAPRYGLLLVAYSHSEQGQ